MRFSRHAAVSALALALLAGCGGSDSDDNTATAPEPSSAASSTSAPGKDSTDAGASTKPGATAKASAGTGSSGTSTDPDNPAGVSAAVLNEAKALAAAGTLVAADFPGYVNSPVVPEPNAAQNDELLYQCLRAAAPTYVSRNPGRMWQKGHVQITSSADVMKSAKMAKQNIIASKSGLAPGCITENLQSYFSGDGDDVVSTNNGVPVTVTGAESAFAVKFNFTISGTQDPHKVGGYIIGAVIDNVRVTIIYVHTDGTEPALADASKLAGVAIAKVKAAQKA